MLALLSYVTKILTKAERPMKNLFQDPEAALEFDHNIVEHLGLKLYRNKPGNVLAELVANSWDAGATEVQINVEITDAGGTIYIVDNGVGMSLDDIKNRYLKVGKPKRRSPSERAQLNRRPMGRKGLGKLAPFGISNTVQVITASNGKVNWFQLSLNDLRKLGESGKYKPGFLAYEVDYGGATLDELATEGSTEANFLARLKSDEQSEGTLVLLQGIKASDLPERPTIVKELGDRFTVVLVRENFQVKVQGQPITEDEALPNFELRIPEEGFLTEELEKGTVRFWAGFVPAASWASDQAGVGVFAHGKIAQDRPFFFNAKGKEVFQRYLYAVVEADWIDEFDDDLIGTDRSSIDWGADELSELRQWGYSKVSSWISTFEAFRRNKLNSEIQTQADGLRSRGEANTFSEGENRHIEKLVADATHHTGPSPNAVKARENLLVAVSKAWVNQPTRGYLNDLWSRILKGNQTSDQLLDILAGLDLHSVPEKMSLALTFSQRAFAVSALNKFIYHGEEADLQKLIAKFPWLLEPRADLLTADRALKTTIDELAEKDEGDRYSGSRAVRLIPPNRRADFVFLSATSGRSIRVAEIKRPGIPLNGDHIRQLRAYVEFISEYRRGTEVTGVLVGNPEGLENHDSRLEIKTWDEVLLECRNVYIQLIVAMIDASGVEGSDTRLRLIQELGGDEVWELLRRMSEDDAHLRSLFDEFGVLPGT